ncbi:MAG: RidA family protein [Gemmatimonadetes bacterium]|nr:RidA family protein [Gemmatimonadota bacterium]
MKFDLVNPPELPSPTGFNHGLLAPAGGRTLFVAGQPGLGEDGKVVPGGFVAQFAQALDNTIAVVRAAGGDVEHIGRMTIYVTDLQAYLASRRDVGVAWRERLGKHFPAVALVEVRGLVDEGAVLEIETTAVVP